MPLFDVYPLFDIEPVKARGAYLWDRDGKEYLDLYGGHAVISIGHQHPKQVTALQKQLSKISFYSNSVQNTLQQEYAQELGRISAYPDHQLFLCNSGAEANENALKCASFHNKKSHIITFKKAFHGRTSAAVAVTDNPKLQAPINENPHIIRLPWNNKSALKKAFKENEISSLIIEGIQGVGGIHEPKGDFLQLCRKLCDDHDSILILDEVQSGFGRTGYFFAHQWAGIEADIISMAKGMGNGFPMGGILIHPKIKPWAGMLGSTFGGNHLACVAGRQVLEVIEEEQLRDNAFAVGDYLLNVLSTFPKIKDLRGKGLMIGIDFDFDVAPLRKQLLMDQQIFTGASGKRTLRLLPPLSIGRREANRFLEALYELLQS